MYSRTKCTTVQERYTIPQEINKRNQTSFEYLVKFHNSKHSGGKWLIGWFIKTLVQFSLLQERLTLKSIADNKIVFVNTDNRVPNRFGGMRDLAFFRRDIRDLSWKQGQEAGIKITSGSGISCFYGVGMRDSQGELSGILDLNYYMTS